MTSTQHPTDPVTWPTQVRLPGQTAAHPGPVDMTMMYVMHHAFRRDLAVLSAAAAVTPATDRRAWAALADRWALFAEALHLHHSGEDQGLWPRCSSRHRRGGRGAGGDGGRARWHRPDADRVRPGFRTAARARRRRARVPRSPYAWRRRDPSSESTCDTRRPRRSPSSSAASPTTTGTRSRRRVSSTTSHHAPAQAGAVGGRGRARRCARVRLLRTGWEGQPGTLVPDSRRLPPPPAPRAGVPRRSGRGALSGQRA